MQMMTLKLIVFRTICEPSCVSVMFRRTAARKRHNRLFSVQEAPRIRLLHLNSTLLSESEASDDATPKKKSKSYKRLRIKWEPVLFFVKGDEATVDEGEMKHSTK